MAGIPNAIRRVGRHSQDWFNQAQQAATTFLAIDLADTGQFNTVNPTPWLSATATGDSEWLEMKDGNLLLVQVNVLAGTFTAKVQGSIDNGKTFYDLRPLDASTGALLAAVTTSAAGLYLYNYPCQFVKVNVSALATGPTEFWYAVLQAGGGR